MKQAGVVGENLLGLLENDVFGRSGSDFGVGIRIGVRGDVWFGDGNFRFYRIAETGLGDVLECDFIRGGRQSCAGEALFFSGFDAGFEVGLFF